ncbi:hypothetical protein BROUX41_005217 [Berkeleyomyces rouxiae]|uniref:uncharacterized protein n=1 Tax=Berkeleyomyces rouxiae TaxID=2035830 RepID=UPI003B820632
MSVWDMITDLVEAAKPWSEAHAEASEENDEPAVEAPADEDEEEEEEEDEDEDEEEEEVSDPMPAIVEACQNSAACHEPKHHYDECVARVTGQIEADGAAKEDCVEEFFHLAHCANECMAPKLWAKLK